MNATIGRRLERAGRIARRALACASVAFASLAAVAQTAPGSTITNQARATGQLGATGFTQQSNVVRVTVGNAPVPQFGASLTPSHNVTSRPGATLDFAHALTNHGTVPDTFTLSATDLNGGFSFAAITLLPDADGDGNADSATPLSGPQVVGAGQTLRFVARVAVPASASRTGSVRIAATAASNTRVEPVHDMVTLQRVLGPADCAIVAKTLSRDRGPSPAGPVTVTLTYSSCDQARAKVTITDVLPQGMRYIAGSGRASVTGATVLTDAVQGADLQGSAPAQVAYDFNATLAGAVTATVHNVPAQVSGTVSFDVEIAAGLAPGTVVTNGATYVFHDANGTYGQQRSTNTASYQVDGRIDFELAGDRLPTATPGTPVTFTNVLRNRGDVADTYDVTLSGSTFPAGTVLTLLKPDGVTPLADTDGDGTPDTGVVAPGAEYRILVRALIPSTAIPGAYKVVKTARSSQMTTRFIAVDDAVDTIATKCDLLLEPDNSAQVGFGQHVTYTHHLTNRGNCRETVRAMVNYLGNDRPGWTAAAFLDGRGGANGSLPGALDATDVRVQPGWSQELAPGESLRILVDVLAPTAQQAAAMKQSGAKAFVDRNVTTLVVASNAGDLTVRDTTIVDDKNDPVAPDNAIRNFPDDRYTSPTLWAVIGWNLYLRADAQACNAAPDVVESRRVTIVGPGGEREEVNATETGPNTGLFMVAPMPVRAPPVVAGDGVLQGRAGDTFEIEMLGCGRRISTLVTLMQPTSTVFDSVSNAPVEGATVTLVQATGGQCGTVAANVQGNPATTTADGRFAFPPLAAGSYCLAVRAPNGYRFPSQVAWPMLPAGRNLNVTGNASGGSYGNAFPMAAGGLVVVDVPLDSAAQDGLFVQKEASRTVAEIGAFVDYAIRVRNGTGNVLDRADVLLTDDLPLGFSFVPGSGRRDGKPIADPAGGLGPQLRLPVGRMARDEQVTVTYRVRVGPGAMQGDGVNRAQASYAANGTATRSNVGSVKVQVTGGVFTDKGFILGKVYMDCNANGVQDKGELGVPGVRLVLEDGTYVLTDGEGKYSFYGISNRTHILKTDRVTLPAGSRLAVISARQLGDAGSRLVDLKSAEMHRADFALAGCEAPVVDEVKRRAEANARGDELSTMVGAQLATEARPISDVKALPAAGVIAIQPAHGTTAPMPGASQGQQGVAPMAMGAQGLGQPAANGIGAIRASDGRPSPAPRLEPQQPKAVELPLEELLPSLDNKLAFVGLADGETLGFAQTSVRVKGTAGAVFKLSVNGADVSDKRVGKRAVLAEKQVQAWEYIGIDLKPGENTLVLSQVDGFGNARGNVTVKVIAPDQLSRLAIALPAGGAIADGKTLAQVVVKLTDAKGVPVTVRTPVTLESAIGRWQVDDLDAAEPGVQVMIEGGQGTFALQPPLEPASTQIVVRSGPFKAEARLDFLPELRNLMAAGVVEGIVNLRRGATAIQPARASDGFEQELRQLSREWDNGRGAAGARAAFYLKGKIRGDFLLTAAYDSDKDTKDRLFRDIQPDEFYPIYGDAAVRGFDAQSTSRLYVRVDHKRSYLLWGDFTTQATGEARKLSNYSRSLTGAKHHYENERVSINAFASRDSTRQVIEELRANGTSGPFQLGTPNFLVNSEKVEIVVRDRNQPALIISALAQTRFADYEIESLTGRILFRAPVPSLDSNLNPVFVRVTYEVDQGGDPFWVAGIDAQVKVTDRIEVGGVYVRDENPLVPFTLAGANMTVKLGENTFVIGEAARTEKGVDDVRGEAARLEIKHDTRDLKAHAFVARSDKGFDNPGAYLTNGRSEMGGKLEYKLSPRTTIRGEALRTEDITNDSKRDGLAVSIQHQVMDRMTLEIGVRHAAEKGATSAVPPVTGQPSSQPMPDEVTTVRARVTGSVPGVDGLTIYGEAEVDVQDADRKVIAAGGEYQLPNKGRIYARHEFVSSITGPYGLNQAERQNSTAIGVDTEYMRDGRLFSEYRIRDAMSGGDVEAALGLKNLWNIAPGLRLGTTFERVEAIAGSGQNENTAAAFALEYTGSKVWKGSTRLEVREGATQDSILFTVGLAARIARDWTALARNAYTRTRNDQGGEHVVDRMQAGLAFRDNETNRWNVLARVEHRLEKNSLGTTTAGGQSIPAGMDLRSTTDLVSVHADWQPVRPFLVSGRYAAKWTTDKSNGLSAKYRAQVVGGRATWEFAPKWDVSFVSSILLGDSTASRQYGVGIEVGYLLATNLWVSAGYNFSGYKDADLSGADYTAKGPFLRLRYKFDESLFEGTPIAAEHNKTMTKVAGEGTK